jgi:hypothetical protein
MPYSVDNLECRTTKIRDGSKLGRCTLLFKHIGTQNLEVENPTISAFKWELRDKAFIRLKAWDLALPRNYKINFNVLKILLQNLKICPSAVFKTVPPETLFSATANVPLPPSSPIVFGLTYQLLSSQLTPLRLRVRITLRPVDYRQSVCLGTKPLEAHDQ